MTAEPAAGAQPPRGEPGHRRIGRILSGGQTGADRGGLDAALDAGVPCGGWCPKGRLAEDGVIPSRYPVRELDSPAYAARTEANVIEADATVVFTCGPPAGGSLQTVDFARAHRKPCLHVDLAGRITGHVAAEVADWLDDHAPPAGLLTLNVAGSRESQAPGIRDRVREVTAALLGRGRSGRAP